MQSILEMGGCRPRVLIAGGGRRYTVVVGRGGVKLYEINVGAEGGTWGMSRHRSMLNEGTVGKVRYIKCFSGKLDQTVPLPVNAGSVPPSACFKAGVLEVRFLKQANGQPVSVAVNVRKNR